MTNAILFDLPEDEYHARPELSSTQARHLLESPAKYRYELGAPAKPKAAWDLGTAVHTKVLGAGSGAIPYPPEHLTPSGNVSTKAATVEWAAEQRAAGLTPITPEQMLEVDAMAESVLAHPSAAVLFGQDGGASEVSVFSTDPETGLPLRARFDYLARIAVDLKSARDASPNGFAKAAASHGYHVQRGHYKDTHEQAGGQLDGFVFVVVETEAPYLVGVYRLNSQWEQIGVEKAREARRILRHSLDTDTWPGYGDDIQSLMAPFWLIADAAEPEIAA